jgi:dTDP-4-dehydrorhamnose 3,5-epimerase
LIAGVEVQAMTKRVDQRGWLLKMLMRPEIDGDTAFGEIYVTVALPGVVKGIHYHEKCTEWFCVICGKGKLVLLDRHTSERCEIAMGDENMVRVRVPPQVVHAVKNVGHEMMYMIAYADRPYDPSHPDTIPYPLDCDG